MMSVSGRPPRGLCLVRVCLCLLLSLLASPAIASVLADAARALAPGAWVELRPVSSAVIARRAGGDIAEYSNQGVWDAVGQRVYFCGSSHHGSLLNDCVAYDEAANTWLSIGVPWFIVPENGDFSNSWGHGYTNNAFEPTRQELYMRIGSGVAIWNVATNTWRYAPMPDFGGSCAGITMFTASFPAQARMVVFNGRCKGQIASYDTTRDVWQLIEAPQGYGLDGDAQIVGGYSAPFQSIFLSGGSARAIDFYQWKADNTFVRRADAPAAGIVASYMVADPVSGHMLQFVADRTIYAFDPVANVWTDTTVPSKIRHLDGSGFATPLSTHGVVMVVEANGSETPRTWLYKHTASGGIPLPPMPPVQPVVILPPLSAPGPGRTLQVGPTRTLTTPAEAAAVVQDGDTVAFDPATYTTGALWTKHNLTLTGVGGVAHMRGGAVAGKAIWLLTGNNTTIEHVHFSRATVGDGNGAGVKLEGKGLTIRHSRFTDSENGLLSGGVPGVGRDSHILVEYSEFARNGHGDPGRNHNIYIGEGDSFTLQHSWSTGALGGHLVKSRALTNSLLYNRLVDTPGGTASYEVDLPCGGLNTVLGNIIRQDAATENSVLLAHGNELHIAANCTPRPQALFVAHNTFINDRYAAAWLQVRGTPAPQQIVNNLFVGAGSSEVPLDASNVQTTAPAFLDVAAQRYQSTAASPGLDKAVDVGVALTPVWEYVHPRGRQARTMHGTARDVGAYEWGSPVLDVLTPPACDPLTHPAPHYREEDGGCVPSCGVVGGTLCSPVASCPAGHVMIPTPSFGCAGCCRATTPGEPPAAPLTLTVLPQTVPAGAVLTLTWAGVPSPQLKDWLSLVPVGTPETGPWMWYQYTQGVRASGTLQVRVPTGAVPGAYEVRFYAEAGQRLHPPVPVVVTAAGETPPPPPLPDVPQDVPALTVHRKFSDGTWRTCEAIGPGMKAALTWIQAQAPPPGLSIVLTGAPSSVRTLQKAQRMTGQWDVQTTFSCSALGKSASQVLALPAVPGR